MKAPVQHRILFVDDNPILRACLGDYLRFHGFEIHTAADGREAFKIMREHEPDLILVDPVMPGKKGTKFLKLLTQRSGHLRYPVLVYTADPKMKGFYASTGVEGFLSKEASELELVAQIKAIVAKHGRHLTFDAEGARQTTRAKPTRKRKKARAKPGVKEEAPGLRVLLTEDDDRISYSLRRSFRKKGYVVELALNPNELFAAAEKNPPDVIVIKEVLSGTSGSLIITELAQSEETRSIPVVLYDDTKTLTDRVTRRLADLSVPIQIVRKPTRAALHTAVEAVTKKKKKKKKKRATAQQTDDQPPES